MKVRVDAFNYEADKRFGGQHFSAVAFVSLARFFALLSLFPFFAVFSSVSLCSQSTSSFTANSDSSVFVICKLLLQC